MHMFGGDYMIEESRPCLTWTKAALIRAVRTFAQAAIAMIPVGVTIEAVDWRVVLGTAGLAAVLSILTSLAGLPETNGGPLDGEVS